MDKITRAINTYEGLINKTYIYKLLNGNTLEVMFKKENFPHVIGLHKLVDINEFKRLNNKTIKGSKVFKIVKKKEINPEKIINSPNYKKIEKRIDNFHKINDLVFNRVIYDFDRTKVRTLIKADLVLYTIENGMYVHLFLIRDKFGKYVPVTFIVEEDDKYIKGQEDFKITELSIKEKNKDIKIYNYKEEEQ